MKHWNDIDITDVTIEQIGTCYRVVGPDGKPFYIVESASDSTVEYQVKWTREHSFTCTCKAGQKAFSNCKAGYCKHVKYALAARAAQLREEAEEAARQEAERIAMTASFVPVVAPAHWTAKERHDYEKLNNSRERGRIAILQARMMADEVRKQK